MLKYNLKELIMSFKMSIYNKKFIKQNYIQGCAGPPDVSGDLPMPRVKKNSPDDLPIRKKKPPDGAPSFRHTPD